MCGIHGEFAFSGNVDLPRAEARLARLARRGPDGFGIGFGDFRGDALRLTMNETPPAGSAGNAFLGHRRLSIVDLSDAALQPMATADGNYVLLFNGEIYNAAELRPVLEARGHRFVTHHSDTEVLLRAFVEWGERCLPYFVGMFAFAVYCRRERKVFLARDRIGQKPLYYRMSREGFGFSSELTALAVGERERAALDREALAQYLMFGYVPDPRSILAGIAKLPPAHCAWVDLEARTFHARPYWDVAVRPASEDETAPPLEWRRRVHDALEKAVARRLIADVPIGVFLSGGIDSTLIAKMIAKHHDGGIRAYTAEFAARSSERRWAEQAAERYKLDLSVTLIDLDAAPRYHEVLDAPSAASRSCSRATAATSSSRATRATSATRSARGRSSGCARSGRPRSGSTCSAAGSARSPAAAAPARSHAVATCSPTSSPTATSARSTSCASRPSAGTRCSRSRRRCSTARRRAPCAPRSTSS
jgi:asparagine synthase (glutamine-hydrolysing)